MEKDKEFNSGNNAILHLAADERQNKAGTGTPPDTGLTQANLASFLARLRKAHGFDSAIGGHSSTLLEAFLEVPGYVRPAWASHPMMTLPWKMKQVAESLARISDYQ